VANTRKAGPRRTSVVHESEEGEKGSNDEAKPVRDDRRSSKQANDDAMYDPTKILLLLPTAANQNDIKGSKPRAARNASNTFIEDSDDSGDAEGMSVGPHADTNGDSTGY